ncbi:hypothetical protein G3A43_06185 [Paraburkholderia aspalathi]|nr:hypothetical protein [Paraburkholderia aspalathi]MBK3779836.1 hypothetical protein [Paraburkholderia aspalathi]
MTELNAVPLRDILADPTHPAHAELTEFADKVGRGEINMCACMGPLAGEPYCPCEMTRRGLPPSPEREAAQSDAERRLAALVAKGIFDPHA